MLNSLYDLVKDVHDKEPIGNFSERLKEMREGLGLSQAEFADTFGFSMSSIRNWEQKNHAPPLPAAYILLSLIEDNPSAMLENLENLRHKEVIRKGAL